MDSVSSGNGQFDTIYFGIKHSNGEELEIFANAVIHRYAELYPDYEVGLLSLPKNDPEGRKRCIEGVLEFLQKEEVL